MNTEKDSWREDSNEENASRDGNNFNRRDDYNRQDGNRSYNRDNNYNREGRSYSRPYGDSSQRQSYNRYGNDRNNSYNRDGNSPYGNRPQRPYNRDGGNSYNRDGNSSYGNRPQRPYNREGGNSYNNSGNSYYNRDENARPQRPRINRDNNYNRQDRPQYNREDRPWREPQERKPWQNSDQRERRPRIVRPNTDGGSSYNNQDTRPRRPRFNSGDSPSQGGQYGRPVRRTSDYDPNAKYTRKKQIEYKEQYIDPNEPIRLNKFLANAGVCSRREADEFITAGVVMVNDEVVKELGTKIKHSDVVKFHNETVSIEKKVYILLNKPKDCVTTSDDPQSRFTVMEIVKDACKERIYPVGRLDRNTTGVLLLTNDGDLASKLTHPQYLKKKIYHVQLDKNVTKNDLEQIAIGVKLDDETEIKADAVSYTDEVKRNCVGIEIHTGQNRIVRRIFESLGYRVMKLDRVYFAGLTKKGLRRGDWRYLTERELNFLKMGSFN